MHTIGLRARATTHVASLASIRASLHTIDCMLMQDLFCQIGLETCFCARPSTAKAAVEKAGRLNQVEGVAYQGATHKFSLRACLYMHRQTAVGDAET